MKYTSLRDYSDLTEAERLVNMQKGIWKFFCEDLEKYGLAEREGQQNMALDIGDAIEKQNHLIVEAGVGIGKSFAYIVPLLLFHKQFKRPIIISTSTITLQEQLVDDINFISDKINYHIRIIVAKGQTHYVCQKRVNELQDSAFKEHILNEISCAHIEHKDFSGNITSEQWEKISIVNYGKKNCENCIYSQTCYFGLLRKEMKNTNQIVVCNHDLLTVHLHKSKWGNSGLLPVHTPIMVIDEAHNLEEKVRSSLTAKYTINKIMNIVETSAYATNKRGTSIDGNIASLRESLVKLYADFNDQVLQQINEKREQIDTGRFSIEKTPEIAGLIVTVTDLLHLLNDDIQIHLRNNINEQQDIAVEELFELSEVIQIVRNGTDSIIWLEKPSVQKGSLALCFCPEDIPSKIKQLYFSDSSISLLTSATLTNQRTGSCEDMYRYLVNNIGFPLKTHNGILGYLADPKLSPFSYDKNAMIYYATDLPHPRKEKADFLKKGSVRIVELLKLTNGRALVLFTSKADMDTVYEQLKSQNLPYNILISNQGASQESILSKFKAETTSVLLGTGSFWEGINIVGNSLTNVIIFRLPFPVPDPIITSKCARAKDPLLDVLTPEMIISLNQGIGRLIRSETDVGVISIIDPRLSDINKAPYVDVVWESLPIKNRTNDLSVLNDFLRSLSIC